MEKKYCQFCGKPFKAVGAFCPHCGERWNDDEPRKTIDPKAVFDNPNVKNNPIGEKPKGNMTELNPGNAHDPRGIDSELNTMDSKVLEERFKAAYERAKEYLELYKKTPMGMFGASHIASSMSLYEDGDRSIQLLETLESIE